MAPAPIPAYPPDMRKTGWLILSAVVLLLAVAAHSAAGFLIGAVILAGYVLGCVFHPRTIHRSCGGKGYHRSAFFPWATRKCRGCVGGLQVRHGARAVGLQHIKAEHARRTRIIAAGKKNRTWR